MNGRELGGRQARMCRSSIDKVTEGSNAAFMAMNPRVIGSHRGKVRCRCMIMYPDAAFPNRSKAGDRLAGPRHPGGEFLEQEAAGHLGLIAIRVSAKAKTRDLS